MSKDQDKTINRHGDGRGTQKSGVLENTLRALANLAVEIILTDELASKPTGTVEAKCLDIAVRQLKDSDRTWVTARAELTDSQRDTVSRMIGENRSYWMRTMKRDVNEALRIFRLRGGARKDALWKWMQPRLG